MSESYICTVCKKLITDGWAQCERRIEYRRKSNDGRVKTVHLARICESCATAEAEDIRAGRTDVVLEKKDVGVQEGLAI